MDHRKGTMKTRRSSLSIGWLLLVCAVGGFAAQAQDYPTRSVKLITQGAAASGPDVIARIVAENLGRLWGQQVIILNHPGAGGSVAAAKRHRPLRMAIPSICQLPLLSPSCRRCFQICRS